MIVKKCALLECALLCMAFSVRADENPRLELFGGYSYGQLNPGGRLVAQTNPEGKLFSLSGWHVAAQTRIYKNLDFVVEFTGYAGTSDVEMPESGQSTHRVASHRSGLRSQQFSEPQFRWR